MMQILKMPPFPVWRKLRALGKAQLDIVTALKKLLPLTEVVRVFTRAIPKGMGVAGVETSSAASSTEAQDGNPAATKPP